MTGRDAAAMQTIVSRRNNKIIIVHMPISEMTSLERNIHDVIGPGTDKPGGWLHTNLPRLLDLVAKAFARIMNKGKT